MKFSFQQTTPTKIAQNKNIEPINEQVPLYRLIDEYLKKGIDLEQDQDTELLAKILKNEIKSKKELILLEKVFGSLQFFQEVQNKLPTTQYTQLLQELKCEKFNSSETVFKYDSFKPKFKHQSTKVFNFSQEPDIMQQIIEENEDFNIVKALKVGDSFGEIALMNKCKRTASIICKELTLFATLSRYSYDKILSNFHQNKYLGIIYFLKSYNIFKNMYNSKINACYASMEEKETIYNEIIYKPGDNSNFVYFIKEGEFEVSQMQKVDEQNTPGFKQTHKKLKQIKIAVLTSGSYFGEEEVIAQIKRQQQVTCVSSKGLLYAFQGTKIQGGGFVKKFITENKEFIQKRLNITQNEENYLIKQDMYIRKIGNKKNNFWEETIKKQGQPDPLIDNLYKIPYKIYQSINKEKGPKIFEQNQCVIQSQSSALPAFLLYKNAFLSHFKQDKNFDIIDCCSAPGNKTIQLIEYFSKQGKIFAFEKDPKRFKVLEKRIGAFFSQKNDKIQCFNQDFLTVDVSLFPNVKFVLADPSCSGSGMLNHIYCDDTNKTDDNENFEQKCRKIYEKQNEQMKERVNKLAEFQKEILNKIKSFPNLEGFIYSTCSIHNAENEDLIGDFLQENQNFELIDCCPEWKCRGFITEKLKEGNKCLRVNPFEGNSDGFFVALIKKIY